MAAEEEDEGGDFEVQMLSTLLLLAPRLLNDASKLLGVPCG